MRERYLKAHLVCCKIDVPYTHNISALLEIADENTGWVDILQHAEHLTAYAITARYPGEDEAVTKEEALKAIESADEVRCTVRDELRKHNVILP